MTLDAAGTVDVEVVRLAEEADLCLGEGFSAAHFKAYALAREALAELCEHARDGDAVAIYDTALAIDPEARGFLLASAVVELACAEWAPEMTPDAEAEAIGWAGPALKRLARFVRALPSESSSLCGHNSLPTNGRTNPKGVEA